MRGAQANVVVVGGGRLGRRVAAALHARGALAAVVDRDPDARAEARAAGWSALADASATLVDVHVDALVLCVPYAARAALVEAAIGEGKHVLVPAPFASAAESEALRRRALAAGVGLVPLDTVRAAPAVQALLSRLEDLGTPRRVLLQRSRAPGVADASNLTGPGGMAPSDLALLLQCADLIEQSGDTARTVTARLDAAGGTVVIEGGGGRAVLHLDLADAEPLTRLSVSGPRGGLVLDARGLFATPAHGARRRIEVPGMGGDPWAPDLDAQLVGFLAACELADEYPAWPPALCVAEQVAEVALGAGGQGVARLDLPAGVFVHPTAQVDGPVQIGAGTKIWHFSKLLGPLQIGRGCSLGQNVVVERGVRLGDNVKVQNNVSIYSGVTLDDDVFCGPSMVFTNVGIPRSHHPRRGEYLATEVGRGATIGANATVVCGNRLGRYCLVGAGAVVTHAVPDFAMVYGNPARVRGYACVCGLRLALGGGHDPEAPTQATCGGCGRSYTRDGERVILDGEGGVR